MKNIFFSLIVLFTFRMGIAQNLDSIIIELNNQQFEQVLEKVKIVETQSQATGELMYLKALAYKGLYKYTEAMRCGEQSLQLDSTSIRTRFLLADLYTTSGQIGNAILCFKRIIGIDSTNLRGHMKLANLLFQQQNYVEASGHYNYLSHMDTTNWFVLRQLAICYEELQTPLTFPIMYYLNALELNPLDQVSVSRLSRIYFSMNEYKEAVNLTNGFLERDSLNTQVLRLNGYAFLHMREADSAIKKFHKCIALSDTSFFVYKFLGLSYFHKNDYEPTINYLTKAYRIDSTDIQTSFFLGAGCGRLYYKQKGIDYLHHTLSLLKPDKDMVSKVYKELASTYQSFSKYREANHALAQALEVDPTDNEILLQLGKNFDYYLKDYENAIKYYSMYIDSTSVDNDTLGVVNQNRSRSEKRIQKIKEEKFWEGENN